MQEPVSRALLSLMQPLAVSRYAAPLYRMRYLVTAWERWDWCQNSWTWIRKVTGNSFVWSTFGRFCGRGKWLLKEDWVVTKPAGKQEQRQDNRSTRVRLCQRKSSVSPLLVRPWWLSSLPAKWKAVLSTVTLQRDSPFRQIVPSHLLKGREVCVRLTP